MKIILFSFLLLTACTLLDKQNERAFSPSKPKKQSPAKIPFEEKTVKEAKKRILKGLFLTKTQVSRLKKVLKSEKSQDLKDRARMILGRHFLKKSSYKKALAYYSDVKTKPHKNQALLLSAKIYLRQNLPKKALDLLEFLEEELSPAQLKEAYTLKLSLLLRKPLPDKKELLKIYCQILSQENQKNSLYRKEARRLIFQMSEKDLLSLRSEDFIEPVKDLVFFRSGKILFFREKFRKSRKFFKKFLRWSRESALEEKALKYIQAIDSRKKVNRKYIGAILPLSGPSSVIGKKSLKGLKMGLGLHEESAFRLVVLDSRGQPDKARKAVQTLVTKYHVIALTGGVSSKTADALAEESQNFGLPAVLMSQKSHLTGTGGYIFQNGLSSTLIADQLTEYLIRKKKFKRFAVLYPNDPYGLDYTNAFWSAVEKKGGIITGAQFYKPGQTDFNGPVRRLTGLYYLKDRIKEYKKKLKSRYANHISKRKAPKNILPPIVDFEVLFIPDSLKALSLIAPHIAYNDIKGLTLTGPSLWNQEKILKKQAKYIDNIVFADPGLSGPQFRKTNFYKNFLRLFGYKPGLFEVLAYESALALRQAVAEGADSRHELMEKLKNLKKFHGVTGEITVSKKREFLRPLRILKMEEHTLTPVSAL